MFKNKYYYLILSLVLLITFLNINCKKAEESSGYKTDRSINLSLIKGSNVRKNGFLTIKTGKIDYARESIKALSDEYKAQILEESISADSDSSLTITYRIKVKAEYLSTLIDKLSNLGKLVNLRIEAEDVSDETARQSDQIELLTSRLHDAKKANNAELIDSLQSKLNEAKIERGEINKSILYSYINLTVIETAKLSHAFSLGFNYGKEAFIWMIKIIIIVSIACIPLIIVIIIIKLFLAFFRYRWKKLMAYIENLGKGKIS